MKVSPYRSFPVVEIRAKANGFGAAARLVDDGTPVERMVCGGFSGTLRIAAIKLGTKSVRASIHLLLQMRSKRLRPQNQHCAGNTGLTVTGLHAFAAAGGRDAGEMPALSDVTEPVASDVPRYAGENAER